LGWIQNIDGGGGGKVAVGELQNLCYIKGKGSLIQWYLVFHKSILDQNEKKYKVYLNGKERMARKMLNTNVLSSFIDLSKVSAKGHFK
jgi:hypothetical protein